MSACPTRRAMFAAPAAIVAASIPGSALARGATSLHTAGLFAELDRMDARAARNRANPNVTDDDLNAWCEATWAVVGQIADLPNTPAYLALRARAIGCAVESTADLANLDLSELGAHAESTAGILVRQVLCCVLDAQEMAA